MASSPVALERPSTTDRRGTGQRGRSAREHIEPNIKLMKLHTSTTQLTGENNDGFAIIELLLGVVIVGVIAAMAVPSVMTSLNGYRLHADAADLSNYANMARMKATSQYAPYRLNINTATGTFSMEKLCGDTPSSVDASCSGGANPYTAFTTADIELGTQYAGQGDTYSSCRPAEVTSYPGDITGDDPNCASLLQVYFNTRGVPVTSTGGLLSNGGAVVYITNQNNLVDAVTFSLGGRVAVWNWSPGSSKWSMR